MLARRRATGLEENARATDRQRADPGSGGAAQGEVGRAAQDLEAVAKTDVIEPPQQVVERICIRFRRNFPDTGRHDQGP